MPDFPKPRKYNYNSQAQVKALRHYEQTKPGRDIPDKSPNTLLAATWNIANFGTQERRDRDFDVIAELISWFDLVAIQEVKDDLTHLRAVMSRLPGFSVLHSDKAGNDERMAFVWDTTKVALLEKVGEIAIAPASARYIKLPGMTQRFRGFDRNPYLAAFRAGGSTILFVNVHLYFGSDSLVDRNRRALEAYAVGRWADLRRKSDFTFTQNIVALGDFNIPKAEPGDAIYDALARRGLRVPVHSNQIGSTIATENFYDQIAFFPGSVSQMFTGNHGVFDFDGALFKTIWDDPGWTEADFEAYMRYYISDHRIMWAEFNV